jgi:hypothetical protein
MTNKDDAIRIEELFAEIDSKEWFGTFADFDCPEPYMEFSNTNSSIEKRILIPESIAYYLRTHWCGSQKMHDLIETNVQNNIRYQIKDALGME